MKEMMLMMMKSQMHSQESTKDILKETQRQNQESTKEILKETIQETQRQNQETQRQNQETQVTTTNLVNKVIELLECFSK
jgi:hypothetical protein